MQLRRSLGELPAEEVQDILREIRGHILERAETSGGLTEERLAAILKTLGRPEDIAPLYQAEAMMSRARTSFSPWVVLRGALRWAMLSVWGFFLFLVGLFGYAFAFGFLASAVLKPIFPGRVGAWVTPDGDLTIGMTATPGAQDVLGWWLIPIGLAVAALVLVGTTRLLRWALRFARVRKLATS
jgi:uncharacterized membrane protein